MVKHAVMKDRLRQIRFSLRRFFAILLTVALGVAFYSGVRAASPDMRITLNAYYDDQNAADIRLVSTLGLDGGDIEAVKSVHGVHMLQPGYDVDAFMRKDKDSKTFLINARSIDIAALRAEPDTVLNRPVLLEGKWPQNDGECLLDERMVDYFEAGVEESLEIVTDSDPDITDTLNRLQFRVSGIVRSIEYISFDRESSAKGSGSTDGYIFISENVFTMDVYTHAYIQTENPGHSRFSDAYDKIISALRERLETAGDARNPVRFASLKAEAEDKLSEGRIALEDAKSKLADAERELKDAEKKISDGERELEENRKKYKDEITGAQRKLDDAKADLDAASEELDRNSKQLESAQKELDGGKKRLAETLAELEQGEQQVSALRTQIEGLEAIYALLPPESSDAVQTAGQIAALRAAYDEARGELDGAWKQYNEGMASVKQTEKQLSDSRAQLEQGYAEAKAGLREYQSGVKELEKGKRTGAKEIADAEKKLADAKKALADGRAEFDAEYDSAVSEITDAERELADGEKTLSQLKEPVWIPLDWHRNPGFEGYLQNTDRIAAIGLVFPILFFLVAALVSLTNMTRLVEDDRTTIGVYKALGYGRIAIAAKYLNYAGLAAAAGIVLGAVFGSKLFPTTIYNAYGILYYLPPVLTPIDWTSTSQAAAGALACAVLPAFLVCQKELFADPASLMRPRAPREGRRILLERIGFIWKRLNFSYKVTCRNVFRYKKRLLMTVFGIAGCTALVLTAFGLKDSISDIAKNQFEKIQQYDMTVNLNDDAGHEDEKALAMEAIGSNEYVSSVLTLHTAKTDVLFNGKKVEAYIIVTEDDAFEDFIKLRRRRGGQKITLNDDSVIMTEKMMNLLGMKGGNSAVLRDAGGTNVTVTAGAPAENYVNHYIYMTPAVYSRLYGKALSVNAAMARLSESGRVNEDALSAQLTELDGVIAVSFNTTTRANFDDMINALDAVAVVLIVSAAALAFIVLFSLTNINIDERIRELATLKVLGFNNRETAMYLYRENIILTLIGIAAGLAGGYFLCQFVIVTAEIDMVMFGRDIKPLTYILSALITLLFAAIVNFLTIRIVSKINMVESMKSVD